MWIQHIETIGLIVFAVLILLHVGMTLVFKLEKRRKKAAEDKNQSA